MQWKDIDVFADCTGYPPSLFDIKEPGINRTLRCSRKECGNLLREPWVLNCGHRYCRRCLDILQNTPLEASHICVPCIKDLNDDDNFTANRASIESIDDLRYRYPELYEEANTFCKIDFNASTKDIPATKEVNKLHISCPNKCGKEEFKLKDLEEHLKVCRERDVECCQCGDRMKQYDFDTHISSVCPYRIVSCQSCGATGIMYKDLKAHLQNNCQKKPLTCPICNAMVEYSVEQHFMTECEGACPICPETTASHVALESQVQSDKDGHMDGIVKFISGTNNLFAHHHRNDSNSLTLNKHKCGVEISSLCSRIHQVEFSVRSLTDLALNSLKRSFVKMSRPELEVFLWRAQKSAKNKTELHFMDQVFLVISRDFQLFSGYASQYEELKKNVQLHEDDTAEKIRHLERSSEARQDEYDKLSKHVEDLYRTPCYNQIIWVVHNIMHLREEARHGRQTPLYSPPFYTGPFGYKMCLRLFLNGDGEGKGEHVSLFHVVMKGDYDPILDWPFNFKVIMVLKNQKSPSNDIVERFQTDLESEASKKPDGEKNKGSGLPRFALQSRVFDHTNGYVLDDKVFIHVMVDPIQQPVSEDQGNDQPEDNHEEHQVYDEDT